jgi:hypothetical protein
MRSKYIRMTEKYKNSGFTQASNINEYQKIFVWIKLCRLVRLTTCKSIV